MRHAEAEAAMDIIEHYVMIEGEHHKQWVIDQVVRALIGAGYDDWVTKMNVPGYTPWDTGIAP